jgi:hypothetical protein
MGGEVQTAGREEHGPVRQRDPLDEAAGIDARDLAVLEQDLNILKVKGRPVSDSPSALKTSCSTT